MKHQRRIVLDGVGDDSRHRHDDACARQSWPECGSGPPPGRFRRERLVRPLWLTPEMIDVDGDSP